jgi:hypothetical protein
MSVHPIQLINTAIGARRTIDASLAPRRKNIAVVKLSIANQTALLQMDPDAFSLNGWSLQGWTNVHLDKVTPSRFRTLAQSSWAEVAAKKRAS